MKANDVVWGSVVFWYISAIIISVAFPISLSDQAFPYVLSLPEFYLIVLLCIIICLGRDYVWKTFKREYRPEPYHVIQEIDVLGLDKDMAKWEPPIIEFERYTTSKEIYATFALDGEQTSDTGRERSSDQAKAHRGFAFSTPHVDDHYFNPLRDIILFPVELVRTIHLNVGGALSSGTGNRQERAFRDFLNEKDSAEQEVFEIQRYRKWTALEARPCSIESLHSCSSQPLLPSTRYEPACIALTFIQSRIESLLAD